MSTTTCRAEKLRSAAVLLAGLLATAGLDYLCTWLARGNSGVALLWLPEGLTLGLLLVGRAKHRWHYVAVRAVAGWAAHLYYGDTLDVSLVLGAGGALQLGIAGAQLRGHADSLRLLGEAEGFKRFLLWGVALPPLIAGAAVGLALLVVRPDMVLSTGLSIWRNWALASAMGVAIATPLVLAMWQGEWQEHFLGDGGRGNFFSLMACLGTIAVVFVQPSYPLLFIPLPAMLLVASRMSMCGAAAVIAGAGLLASLCTLAGLGPVAHGDFTPVEGAFVVQTFVATAMLATIPIAIVAVARRKTNDALLEQSTQLARSEHLFRLLAEHSSDVVTRTGIDGRRRYISPSVFRVSGYTAAETMAPGWIDPVHPDDLPVIAHSREILATGISPPPSRFRVRHRDGRYLWFESRMTVVLARSGAPEEFISNVRDITAQKLAEDALAGANASLLELSETDGLTGIANRRRFDAVLRTELQRAARDGTPTALLMIDADNFKAYNDRLGHHAGDDCLRILAQTIAAPVRQPSDLVARYGGEEFAIILPGTTAVAAGMIAERLRQAIISRAMPHPANPGGIVTVSIGVACRTRGNGATSGALIEAADAALYAAKRAGRNRVAGAPVEHIALAAD